MSVVFEIGITEKNNQEIEKKESIEVVASKGIVGDRYFHDFNGDREQITLIESENIDYKELTFTIDQLPAFKSYRIKLLLTSTSQVYVPRVKDLRVIALA